VENANSTSDQMYLDFSSDFRSFLTEKGRYLIGSH
jgi:hypothetical protein